MSNLRYYSEFYSHAAFRPENSALYRIEIYGNEGTEAKEMTLSGNDPVVIQWGQVSKIDPVQGSSLTLRIVSETDREYLHLYTTEIGEWTIKVFRNGNLYWTGTLDTELYQEPYSTESGYELEVTFSDFGPLDRMDYEGTGVPTLETIIKDALRSINLGDLSINYTKSTRLPAESIGNIQDFNMSQVSIDSGNFYDEDGEPMSMREVVEAILSPFALRMIQRNGRIEIFDLNAAYKSWPEKEVYWTDIDAELGTDVTYNKVTVILSTYSNTSGISGESDYDTALEGNAGIKYMIDTDWTATANGENAEGFYLAYGKENTSNLELSQTQQSMLFRMNPVFSGQDAVGVLWTAYGNTQGNYNSGLSGLSPNRFPMAGPLFFCSKYEDLWREFAEGGGEEFVPIFSLSKELTLAAVSSKKHMLKLSMDLLIDARYNPFEEAGDYNEKDNYKKMSEEMHIVYVPFRLTLTYGNGQKYYYTNWRQINRLDKPISTFWEWDYDKQGETLNLACLAYYNESDPMKNCAVGGWVTNRQSIGDPRKATKLMSKRGTGEYIPLPPFPGTLKLEIGRGFTWRYGKNLTPGWYGSSSYLYQKLRWLAYKNPKLEIVQKGGESEEGEDIKDSAWIIKSAKDQLDIDLTVGTPGDVIIPTSRAFLRYAATGNVIPRFERAGVTDRLERLLIGTVYSQYAKRSNTLRGTSELVPDLTTLTDAADEGSKYIMIEDVQHLANEESEILMVQYSEDDYQGIDIISE